MTKTFTQASKALSEAIEEAALTVSTRAMVVSGMEVTASLANATNVRKPSMTATVLDTFKRETAKEGSKNADLLKKRQAERIAR